MKNGKKEIILVCGARPNFMKIAPLWGELKKRSDIFNPVILHTGQHYDKNMSNYFFRDLELPDPDINLEVGAGSQTEQTAGIMLKFEKILLNRKPDLVAVVGDVNSTVACSLVASKMMVPVAHVESGLRSFDRGMPEEINRLVTDHLSDMLFTTCQDGNDNLKTEGVQADKIFFVGNIMIDTLMMLKEKVQRSDVLKDLKIKEKEYVVVTIHRPSNVDKEEQLRKIFDIFRKISGHIPIIFPAHPRTQKQISRFNIEYDQEKISIIDPLGYLDFMRLYMSSRFVMTDSGGIQEETTYLGIPCLTMRENTERPVTITEGTNELVGTDEKAIIEASNRILNNNWKKGAVPEFWDGKTSERIVRILEDN